MLGVFHVEEVLQLPEGLGVRDSGLRNGGSWEARKGSRSVLWNNEILIFSQSRVSEPRTGMSLVSSCRCSPGG